MSTYIFAIRIYLDSDPIVANASDIGLYDDADSGSNQVFRWVEDDISSFSPTYTWKTRILKPNSIGVIEESADFANGGNITTVGGCSVKISDTISYNGSPTQFDKVLDDNNIRLNGLRCDVIRFEVSGGSLIDVDGAVEARYTCADLKWNEVQLSIPLETTHFKRRSNLATVINSTDFPNASQNIIGEITPATFGEFKPEFDVSGNPLWDGYARFVKTADKEIDYENVSKRVLDPDNGLTMVVIDPDALKIKIFPVVGNDGQDVPTRYDILFAEFQVVRWEINDIPVGDATFQLPYFVGQYITVIEGKSEGLNRRISGAQVVLDESTGVYNNVIELTVESVFESNLAGNGDDDVVEQSWIKIREIANEYNSDVWPCVAYLNTEGDVITQNLNIFSYDEETTSKVTGSPETVPTNRKAIYFIRLPQYAYEDSDSGTGNNNHVIIDVKQFTSDINSLDCFYIYPVENLKLYNRPNLKEFGLDDWDRESVGLYIRDGGTQNDFTKIDDVIIGDLSNVTDKDFASLWQRFLDLDIRNELWRHFLSFNLPDLPSNTPDSFETFILVRLATAWGTPGLGSSDNSTIDFFFKRFFGEVFANPQKSGWNDDIEGDPELSIRRFENIPEFYYEKNAGSEDNQWFYWDNGENATSFSGYMNTRIDGVNSKDIYNSIKGNCALSIKRNQQLQRFLVEDFIKLYEMAVALKRQINIKREIFMPFQGRNYGGAEDDTWGGRKTAADMINNPIDILEHTLRLMNWSEQDETLNWGKEYAVSPLIDTSITEGGFDYEDLASLKGLRPARQLLSRNEAWTDNIIKTLCKQYFICSYQDPATGKESVSFIGKKSLTDPATTITLSETIGSISEVIYPRAKGIYVEPVVRYAKNYGNGDFQKVIQITNANAETFDSSYVIGLSGTTAEYMWTRAHILWNAYRQIEKPPEDITGLDWCVKDEDAVWFLDTWLSWMGAISTDGSIEGIEFEPKKRISFTVPYDIGKGWFITKHLKLELPHQTDGLAIECIIEKISKNLQKGSETVTVQVILYGASTEISLFVQDTWVNGTILADWQDTVDTQAQAPGNAPDVQDIT